MGGIFAHCSQADKTSACWKLGHLLCRSAKPHSLYTRTHTHTLGTVAGMEVTYRWSVPLSDELVQ